MRHLPVRIIALILVGIVAEGLAAATQVALPSPYVPSGEAMYKQYCAACHGANGRGNGPAASTLKRQPPDLTTLAERHGGKFPYDYVARVLRFGPGTAAHGSSDMPTWGPIFQIMDNSDAHAKDRLRNLSDYLGSLQRRQLSRTQSALMIADTRLRDR